MDGAVVTRLVELYSDLILRISYSCLKETHDAEDICQTVFLKLLTQDRHFDSVEHEKAWIIRATVNACKDHLKRASFRHTVSLDDAQTIAAPQAHQQELGILQNLPEKYRVTLYLYYYEEYSAREIGRILGKSEAAIHAQLSRGRKILRAYYEKEGAYL